MPVDDPISRNDFTRLENRIETKFDQIAGVLNRFVTFEERQANQVATINQLRSDLETLEGKYEVLDRKVDKWIDRGLTAWFVLGTLCTIAVTTYTLFFRK